MHRYRQQVRRRSFWITLLTLASVVGCGETDRIRRYQVPHEAPTLSSPAVAEAETPQRMLAAIIEDTGQAWFLKVLGPVDQVNGMADAYEALVQSLRFSDASSPLQWTLPEGWTEGQGDAMRFATLQAGGLEVSVTKLPWDGSPWEDYVLSNVNRWRAQVKLAPLAPAGLAEATRNLELNGRRVVLVDLSSPSASAGPAPRAATESAADTTTASRAEGAGKLQYELPDGWTAGRTNAFRLAAFDIQRDGKRAEVTLVVLGPSAGSLLENVNRWRAQIGLGPIEQVELDAAVRPWDVDGTQSSYVQLVSPDGRDDAQTILAVVIPRADQTLFVKLLGDRELAADEQRNFESFVKSIRFPASP